MGSGKHGKEDIDLSPAVVKLINRVRRHDPLSAQRHQRASEGGQGTGKVPKGVFGKKLGK